VVTSLKSAILEIRAVCQKVLEADKHQPVGSWNRANAHEEVHFMAMVSPALAQMLLDWIDGEAESHMEMWEKQIIACAEELRRLGC
jgi:hypothetical protein